jgi:hypothetical protein
VTAIGHRRLLLQAIAQLGEPPPTSDQARSKAAGAQPPSPVQPHVPDRQNDVTATLASEAPRADLCAIGLLAASQPFHARRAMSPALLSLPNRLKLCLQLSTTRIASGL